MRGDLSETSVADLCRGLSTAGATGAVEVGDHAGDARIFFRAGDVYWAVSPTPRARLGDRLVNGGLLTQEQLEETLAAQRDSSERTKLGALLVERGLVSRDVIRVFVQEQILDALLEMMGWHAGHYVFNPGEAVDEKLPVDIPVDQLLVEVSRRQSEWDQIQEAIPDLDMIPDFVTGGSSANAALEPDEFTVLANVDGDRSIRDLAEDLGYSEFEAARIVYGLTLLGIVDVRPGEGARDDVDIDVASALEEAITAADLPRVPPSTDDVPRPSVKLHVDDDVRDYLPPHGSPVTAPSAPSAPAADERPDEPARAEEAGADEADEPDEIEPWVAGADTEARTPPSDVGFFADTSAASDPGTEDEGSTTALDDDDFDALLDELAAPLETPRTRGEDEEPPRDEPAAEPEPEPEPVAEEPAPPPPARRGPSGGQGGSGDVSEFLRELSQLAIDEPPPSARPAPAKPEPHEPASEAAEAAASSREEEQRRQAEEKRDAANKKRGLFGWGR